MINSPYNNVLYQLKKIICRLTYNYDNDYFLLDKYIEKNINLFLNCEYILF